MARMPSNSRLCIASLRTWLQNALLLQCFCWQIAYAGSRHVLAPDISSCHLPLGFPRGERPYDCCAPAPGYEPRLFRPTPSVEVAEAVQNSTVRREKVRPATSSADASYAAKLARAYRLMKALPPDDPRSFMQQANIHCAYCNTVYNQANSSQVFQVHHSWLFFPFHRWYLYFHERILARLLGDEYFALPFWNYDHPDGASIPWFFSSRTSPFPELSDASREPAHDMPATVALDHNVDTESRSHIVQMRENANTMYRALLRDASAPERFFGWPYRHDDPPMEHYGCGTVELKPHNTVHDWVGNRSAVGLKDMGTFHLAAHDPLFYAHHAQIDRLWELWKAIPGHRDIDDDDYVNAEFLFYNEYGEMVRVKAGDASDLNLLGYRYEGVDTPWMHYVPDRRSAARAKLNATHKLCVIGEDMLTAPCSFTVARDPSVTKSSPWLEERLVLTMLFNQSQIKVDIYLNYPSVSSTADTGCEEYLTDVSLTQADLHWDTDRDGGIGNKTVRIPITERLISLDLMEEHNIVVTLVPKTSPSLLSAGRIAMLDSFVEYAAPYKRWTNEDEES